MHSILNNCGTDEGKPAESEGCHFSVDYNSTIIVDDVEYGVIGAEMLNSIMSGPQMIFPNGKFMVVQAEVVNKGGRTINISRENIKIADYAQRQFDYYLEVTRVLYKRLSLDNLAPNESRSGLMVFEIPENDTGLELRVYGKDDEDFWKSIRIGDAANMKCKFAEISSGYFYSMIVPSEGPVEWSDEIEISIVNKGTVLLKGFLITFKKMNGQTDSLQVYDYLESESGMTVNDDNRPKSEISYFDVSPLECPNISYRVNVSH
jgi:hypothetical protein